MSLFRRVLLFGLRGGVEAYGLGLLGIARVFRVLEDLIRVLVRALGQAVTRGFQSLFPTPEFPASGRVESQTIPIGREQIGCFGFADLVQDLGA